MTDVIVVRWVNPPVIQQPFNYFMSPTGKDTNTGRLSSPWSLSALNNTQLRNTYSGLRIGLIGDQGPFQFSNTGSGPVSLYSQINGITGAGPGCLLQIQGGSPSSPTYIASCDSSGNYSARIALLDGRDPVTGAYPHPTGAFIGQSDGGGVAPTVYGNVTIDAIRVRGFCYSGILFRCLSSRVPSLIIKNCEVFDNIGGLAGGIGNGLPSNNNPGGIHLTGGTGSSCILTNNSVHDCYTDPSVSYNGYGMYAIELITWSGSLQLNNNHCYNCGSGIGLKDTFQGYGSVDHNYCEMGNFGTGSSLGQGYFGAIAFLCPGFQVPSLSITNNICIGYISARGAGGNPACNFGTGILNNNTIYLPPGTGLTGLGLECGVLQAGAVHPPGTWTWMGNIVYFASGGYQAGGGRGCVNFDWWTHGENGITPTTCDYNWYGANGAGCQFSNGFGAGLMDLSFTTWKNLGYDAHSTYSAVSPFVSAPVALDPSSFALTSSALTAGPGGGPVGATGNIGCDF